MKTLFINKFLRCPTASLWIAALLMANPALGQIPMLVSRPVSRAVAQGSTATLSVTLSGALPITYTWTWYRNGLPPTQFYYPNLYSTNCTIVLTNLQPADAGYVDLDSQNAYGPGPGVQTVVGVISADMATNGFVLNIYGVTNSFWTVNCTTNMPPNWFTLTNFSIPREQTFKFVDLEATNLNRFYEVIPKVY